MIKSGGLWRKDVCSIDCNQQSQPADGHNYATIAVAPQAPQSRGTIDISSSDTAVPPVIDPRWLTDPADQEVAVAGYKRVREIFATNAMQPVLVGAEAFPEPNVSLILVLFDTHKEQHVFERNAH